MNLRKLVAAGTQEGSRCSFEKFCVQFIGDVLGQIDVSLLKKPLDPVQHSIYLCGAAVFGCAVHAGKAGIDGSGGAA